MISKRPDNPETWTVGQLLTWTEEYFDQLELDSPRLDAELLLAEALGCTRLELYTSFERPVDERERTSYRRFVERRARREPAAYILGRREFYSLTFEVTPAVLIPRPETEHLVDVAVARFEERSPEGRLLDLGTGCGNIVVAVLVNTVGVTSDVVDVSRAALDVAERNSRAHGVRARFRSFDGDLFQALPADSGPYTVIVSNPPYVSEGEFPDLMPDVRAHEPRLALVDEKSQSRDGLGYYREIAGSAGSWLEPGGVLAVEVGDGQSIPVQSILSRAGWRVARVVRDLGGVERVVVAESAVRESTRNAVAALT